MISYHDGDGLTLPESPHAQFVDCGPVRNGLPPDTRDWRTLDAYRQRIERARMDADRHRQHIAFEALTDSIQPFELSDIEGILKAAKETL